MGNVVIWVTSEVIEHIWEDAVIHDVTEISYGRPGKRPEIKHSDDPATQFLTAFSELGPATVTEYVSLLVSSGNLMNPADIEPSVLPTIAGGASS